MLFIKGVVVKYVGWVENFVIIDERLIIFWVLIDWFICSINKGELVMGGFEIVILRYLFLFLLLYVKFFFWKFCLI